MAAIPILKFGCCWRIDDGSEVRVLTDKWISNHPTNVVIHPLNEEEREWYVSDLINQDLKLWRSDLIAAKFHKDDVDAILRIPLSHRQASDAMIWLHTKNIILG